MHEASRTLLKSPPELWAECSDAASLNRHLDSFGEIRITRLEPETAVAWEGDTASGTVRLEPSGWGTRVILTARGTVADGEEAETEPAPPEPVESEPTVPEPVAVVVEPAQEPVVTDPLLADPVVAEAVGEAELAPDAAVEAELEPDSPKSALEAEPEPAAPTPAQPAARSGFLARIKAWMRGPEPAAESPVTERPPGAEAVPEVEPVISVPEAVEPERKEPGVAFNPETEPESEPEAVVKPEPQPVTASVADEATPVDALTQALNSLGMAHHRPFSRS